VVHGEKWSMDKKVQGMKGRMERSKDEKYKDGWKSGRRERVVGGKSGPGSEMDQGRPRNAIGWRGENMRDEKVEVEWNIREDVE
jgi:hypothetical protein